MRLHYKLEIRRRDVEHLLNKCRTVYFVEYYDMDKRRSYVSPCGDGFRIVQRIWKKYRTPKKNDVKITNVYYCDYKHVRYLRQRAHEFSVMDKRNTNRIMSVKKGG
jgi:hypothetical protein